MPANQCSFYRSHHSLAGYSFRCHNNQYRSTAHSVSDFKGTTYFFRMNKPAWRDAALETTLAEMGSWVRQVSFRLSGQRLAEPGS